LNFNNNHKLFLAGAFSRCPLVACWNVAGCGLSERI